VVRSRIDGEGSTLFTGMRFRSAVGTQKVGVTLGVFNDRGIGARETLVGLIGHSGYGRWAMERQRC
jgi:hypothetical protein